jgi:Ca-activated chloride channel family protein
MIHFAWPWLALLAPLPWLLYRFRSAADPQSGAVYLPFLETIGPVAAADTLGASRSARAWFAVLWLLLILAALRPQVLGDPLPVPTTGRQLLLAVDVSGSMATPDMGDGATRLQTVQRVAGRFIDGRHGDQVGLILFGTQPYLQAPLTPDLATVHRFLNEAVVGIAGPETAIGDAIGLAIKRLRANSRGTDHAGTDQAGTDRVDPDKVSPDHADDSRAKQAILVLLTDGESNAGAVPPLEAARLAKEAGLRIYTIGVGAIPQSGFFGSQGNNDLDEDTLKAIAKTTGGEYFRAADADALREVYHRIDQLEPAAGHEQWLRPAQEWFSLPLGIALALSIPAVWLGARRWE